MNEIGTLTEEYAWHIVQDGRLDCTVQLTRDRFSARPIEVRTPFRINASKVLAAAGIAFEDRGEGRVWFAPTDFVAAVSALWDETVTQNGHPVMIPFEYTSARETARAVGGKWDALKKAWRIPAHEVERIQMLLEKEQGKA